MDQSSSSQSCSQSSSQSSSHAFLAEIEAFLQRAGMSPSGFGRAALRDPNFVRDLRGGRAPSLRLVDRARAFMAARRDSAQASAA
ncbi:MAG TPA: hypothetical protein VKX28_29400 [Xanthobacteraceae bacterium]|nr:hypothetical protein [Xanthobacteraceae bacterium]